MPYNAALPPENTDPWYTALITNWLGGLRTFVNGLETSLGFKADTTAVAELARDALGTAMESANSNLTIAPNDAGDKIVFTVSGGGGGGITLEEAVDTVAAAITVSGATGLTKTYDDAANGGVGTITLGVTGAVVRAVQVVTGSEARPSGVDTVIWIDRNDLGVPNQATNDVVIGPGDATITANLVNAKGDLLVGTADNVLARFPVGANGKVLKADSTQTSGLIWADDATGGGGGGGSANVITGTGSPLGVVTPPAVGAIYHDLDATNGAITWRASGSGNNDWKVINGDTGWRNVTSTTVLANLGLASNGATQIAIRRIDNQVYLRGKALESIDTTKHDKVWMVPDGFRSGGDNTDNHMILVTTDAAVTAGQVYGQVGLRESDTTQWWFNTVRNNMSFRGNWQTVQPWPTGALPGSATS